ncbi:MAG: fumarylacetoacetate hydrolase family protein [Candidatus Omnitrophica bacterium]|nr:fumarylacetoacetate hydrolase family protein [Candidatus Omnitrophota bacterium]MCM8776767.1 fumarylacetoacetate hydrolase family protein [Candidatus Omnitrophota bacterium]
MRYVRVVVDGLDEEGNYGIIEGETIRIIKTSPLFSPCQETGIKIPFSAVRKFLPPVEPPNIIALGLNYREHARESDMKLPSAPVIFLKATTAITGHLSPIVLPNEAPDFVDYEAELVIVIKKKAKDITPEDASDYILGYTCGNDISARDCQLKLDRQWARAKSFDTFAPVGPWIETDINPDSLEIQSRVNGVIMQKSNTVDMIFSVSEIVSYLSRQMTLLPGTLIMTGTPSGVGFAKNPPIFLREGDTVEIEIEGIGILKNPVVRT